MDKKQISVILYYEKICAIGGIESWIYYFCQRLHNYYAITVLCKEGDPEQLKRLSKIVDVERYDSKRNYECDVFINSTNWKPFPRNISYGKCIALVHCDYNYFREQIKLNRLYEGVDDLICVSEHCSEGLYKAFGEKGTVIPNILGEKVNTKKILRLVSFTRLTEEKGLGRMIILAKALKEANVRFEWTVFTEFQIDLGIPEVVFKKPTLDVYDYISDADYLVQLSSSEAFCYSVHEALQYGTPVLVTDIAAFHSLVEDGVNGYKFNLSMNDIDIDKIVNHIPKGFEYEDKSEEIKEKWFDVLGDPVFKETSEKKVSLKVVWGYFDLEFGREMRIGEEFETSPERAVILTGEDNQIKRKLCEVVR